MDRDAAFIRHVTEVGQDVTTRQAVVLSLQAVTRVVTPLLATFFTVGEDGVVDSSVVHGSSRAVPDSARLVQVWTRQLRPIDPLAAPRIADVRRRVVTWDDVGAAPLVLGGGGGPRGIYQDIGVINDARLLVRDGDRLVAGITLWRLLRSARWTRRQLRALSDLQPLIEQAYVSALRSSSEGETRALGPLSRRERDVARLVATGASNVEVARALHISSDTAKSHMRAVLSKLGLRSRREVVMLLKDPSPGPTKRPVDPEAPHEDDAAAGAAVERLLTLVLDWAAERIGAVAGGSAIVSARLELVAEASASGGRGGGPLDTQFVRWIQEQVFPTPGPGELLAYVAADPAQPAVVQLDPADPLPGHERLGELAAKAGLTPVVLVLRSQGRVAALVWLACDPRRAHDERTAMSVLRDVQPLVEIAFDATLHDHATRGTASADLSQWGLTPRELAVAQLVLAGKDNAEIAGRLGMSAATARNHLTRVLAKTHVRTRTQLIARMTAETPAPGTR